MKFILFLSILTVLYSTCYCQVKVSFRNSTDSTIDVKLDQGTKFHLGPHSSTDYYNFSQFSKQPGYELSTSTEFTNGNEHDEQLMTAGNWLVTFFRTTVKGNWFEWHITVGEVKNK